MISPLNSLEDQVGDETAERDTAETPEVRIGRYKLVEKIGAGGMGEIYLGEDERLNRKVALKLLPALFTQDADRVRRFELEAKAASALNHPSIITIYEVGEARGAHYIVMEYIQGKTLRQQMVAHMSIEAALDIAIQMANALKAAHEVGIVHRDIKPENVMVRPDGLVKVLDFGIAKLLERPAAPQQSPSDEPIQQTEALEEFYATRGDAYDTILGEALDPYQTSRGEATNETAAGVIMGTVTYMSPEQLRGQKVDTRADIFSLGVVLFEVMTGISPFADKTKIDRIAAILSREPAPLASLRPEVPSELDRIISKALRKDRDARYQQIEDLLADLKNLRQELEFQAKLRTSTGLNVSSLETQSAEFRSDPSSPSSVQRTDREAERRQLTVLVCGCHLFKSEAYLELDAEDQARVLGAFEEACEKPVRQFGGTVVQCNEKGLLACFGFPVAYENAADRAARAAQDILEVMKALGEQFGREEKLDLDPWIGIHTGPAIVELKAGVVVVVGEARNVALQLEEVAVAGQVICTEASYRVFQGRFQCATLGRQKVRGISQPLERFRVERTAVSSSLLNAVAPAELSPLTGRDQEVNLLKDRWEQAKEGMGQVVLLTGDPGIGKSRLVHTLKEHVLGQMVEGEVDAPVIEWRCSPHFQNTRLYPATEFYERALAFDREEPAEARFERMLQRLEQYGLVRPETAPLWASLLSLPIPDRFPALSLSPIREREETFRAMLEWLHTRAARKPILFIIEDLHWVDASTLEFLGQFLAEGQHDSILTLLTFRPEFKAPWPAVAHQTSLALNRLTRRQVGELMRKKTEDGMPEALIDQVYQRAGGVPLFVEEFSKMVRECGVPDREAAGSTGGLLGREIPATLQDLMMARLDRMEGERELAQLAATLGREFSHELLVAVAAMDETTLDAWVAKLVQAEILHQKGRPQRCSYIFKHALLEDALYNSLVKGKRQQFHRRIAQALEAKFPQTVETQPELLAHHFTEAGIGEQAVGYWFGAGLRGLERSANVEAIGHLTKGLALVLTFAESTERDAQELQFLNPLGTAYIATRGYAAPEVGPIFKRARELCERVGNPTQQFAIMRGAFAWNVVRGNFRLCGELAAEAMEFARKLNDPGIVMEALFLCAVAALYRADFTGARQHCERAISEYDDRERTKAWSSITGEDSGVGVRVYLALSLWHLGYPDQALLLSRETIELARTIGHPFSLEYALHHYAWLRQHCRLGDEAQAAGEEQIEIATEQGFAFWNATGTLYRGAGLILQSCLESGLPLLVDGLESYRATGAELALPYYLGLLGDGYTKVGKSGKARAALDDALSIAEKNDDRFHEAELHRLMGELYLSETDQQADAERGFHTAIETARRQQSRAWELRATMSLARLWQRQGRRDEARDALAAAYDMYTEGFTTPDLVDAKALLKTFTSGDSS